MSDLIHTATSDDDYAAFATLVSEYVEWCRKRYATDAWFIDQVFGYQSLASELLTLSTAYGPPNGKTLLARRDGQIVGAGAYRCLSEGTCEMKRLYVSERFHGHGTGRALCAALIDAARADGYQLMQLDTSTLMTEAIALYRTMDFRECPPYRQYPAELTQYLMFMALPL